MSRQQCIISDYIQIWSLGGTHWVTYTGGNPARSGEDPFEYVVQNICFVQWNYLPEGMRSPVEKVHRRPIFQR